jgi:hypothetical protein
MVGVLAVGIAIARSDRRPVPGEERRVTVYARVLAANGLPHGAGFAVVGGTTRKLLIAGRTDNLGEIEATVEVPEGNSSLLLLVNSRGMLRNTVEDWTGPHPGLTTNWDWDSNRWFPFSISSIDELLDRYGEEHREILVTETGRSIESVSVRRPLLPGGVVDFGDVRLPYARAALCLEVFLEDEKGDPFEETVLFSGYDFERLKKKPWQVYSHVALAQRGNMVRILFAPGAYRLLLSRPDDFIALETMLVGSPDPEDFRDFRKRSFLIPVPKDIRERLGARGTLRFHFRHTVKNATEGKQGVLRRPNPTEPQYWWLASPTFE